MAGEVMEGSGVRCGIRQAVAKQSDGLRARLFDHQAFLDIVEDGFRVEHEGMEDDGVGMVLGAFPDRGLRGEDDEIHGGALGDDGDVAEAAFGGFQVF